MKVTLIELQVINGKLGLSSLGMGDTKALQPVEGLVDSTRCDKADALSIFLVELDLTLS